MRPKNKVIYSTISTVTSPPEAMPSIAGTICNPSNELQTAVALVEKATKKYVSPVKTAKAMILRAHLKKPYRCIRGGYV
jgi:hypothetical protein